MNSDGSGANPLTKLTNASVVPVGYYPAISWSPDSHKIAYDSNRALDGSDAPNPTNTSNIWVMNSDGSAALPLTKLTIPRAYPPIWSPDGRTIAFVSDRALDGSDAFNTNHFLNIWIMNADGSGVTPLTRLTTVGVESNPVWSPDGRKIAFISRRAFDGSNAPNPTNAANIWAMNADGSSSIPLTKLTSGTMFGGLGDPVWATDSSKVAYVSFQALDGSNGPNPTNTDNIWTAKADGSGATPLTKLISDVRASCFSPTWSPDGSKIAFLSERALDGSDAVNSVGLNLWVMNADGSNPMPVTSFLHSSAQLPPAWSADSRQLVFGSPRLLDGSDASYPNNNPQNIWIVNVDGSGAMPLTRLTATDAQSFNPQWRPH